MKLISPYKPINISHTLLYLFILVWSGIAIGQTSNNSFEKNVSELIFTPITNNPETEYSLDNQKNTWLKITIPTTLLNKPLILQFPSTHVKDYCIYAKRKSQWLKIDGNTDLQGGIINPQYQENHFITDNSTIYFKSKGAYINNGDFILVERGEYRSVMLSSMIKLEVFYSLFLISIALNVILYFIFKERVTLIYSLFIISVNIICLVEDGLFYFLSGGEYNEMYALAILIPGSCLIFSLFVYLILDLKRLPIKLKYFYLCIIVLYAVLGISLYLTNSKQYFIFLINSALGTALLTIILALMYSKKDLSIRIIAYSFSVVALTAIAYYLSIYPGNYFLSFITMDKIRVILSVTFIVSSYALWIKVKKLKLDHEYLISEFKSLKTDQERTLSENEKYKETVSIFNKKKAVILSNESDEAKQVIIPKDILRDKYLCTEREIEVMICIWEGLSNQEIAERLSISLSTTKQHVSNAYIKLEVKNRSQAMMLKSTINT